MPHDLNIQELQAKLFECTAELEIYQQNEKEKEWIKKENQQLQVEKLILMERLHKADEKIKLLMEEKMYWSGVEHEKQLMEQSWDHEIKKLNATADDFKRQVQSLKAVIEELCESNKHKDQLLLEQKQQFLQAQESFMAKKRALEENIAALNKVNAKLEEALQHRNNIPNEVTI